MEFDSNTLIDFKIHSAEVLTKINDIKGKDTLGKSSKRFGKRTYNNYPEIKQYVLDNMSGLFGTFHDTYTTQNPGKRVLYVRHNVSKDVLEMFSSGNCVLVSKVFSNP
jgi:hypothetical protein